MNFFLRSVAANTFTGRADIVQVDDRVSVPVLRCFLVFRSRLLSMFRLIIAADVTQGGLFASMNYMGSSMALPYFHDSGIVRHQPVGSTIGIDSMSFGRIRGSRKVDLATHHHFGGLKLFENRGYKGLVYGDRCRYCDMTNSGSESYISIGPSGSLKFYQNLHNSGYHTKYGQILPDQGISHRDVHLADLDADGKCKSCSVAFETRSTDELKAITSSSITRPVRSNGAEIWACLCLALSDLCRWQNLSTWL
jgi:hypothetical protein